MSSQHSFLHGTIRALTQDMSLLVQEGKNSCRRVAAAFDMEVEVELKQGGYPTC